MSKFGKNSLKALRGTRKTIEVELPELRDEDGTPFSVFFLEPSVADLIEILPYLDDLDGDAMEQGRQSGKDMSIQANVLADIGSRIIIDPEDGEPFLDVDMAKALIYRRGAEPLAKALADKLIELRDVRTGDETSPSFPDAQEESGSSDSDSASPSDSSTPTK